MLKILYAANNYTSSFYSLKRFVDTYSKFYQIRTAAYSKSIQNINVNWTLDCLLDFKNKYQNISFKNSNFDLYLREIKRFNPDLIISDIEIYTSYAGIKLNIPVWQVSPLLLYYAIDTKHNLYKYYSGVINKDSDKQKYIIYIINNSIKKLIPSHLGDLNSKPILKEEYEWIRPNYNYNLSVPMSCGIGLADLYYNNIKNELFIDYSDPESIITSHYNKLYDSSNLSIDNNIKFLSQHLKELDI